MISTDARDRLCRLPKIRRAREFRLYTADGRRIIDLWQAGGRAILGHRGGGVVSAVKRVLDRGVLTPFPSVQERRLEQALGRLFPELPAARVAVFGSEERAIAALSRALAVPAEACLPAEPTSCAAAGFAAPASDNRPDIWYWRPFLPIHERWEHIIRSSAIIPVLPDGGLFPVQPVVFSRELELDLKSDLVPEPALAALTAAVHALASAHERRLLAVDGFTGIGPYLVPDTTDGYDRLFDGCLDAGVLISPDPAVPSIVPGVFSDGERAQIITAIRRWLSG